MNYKFFNYSGTKLKYTQLINQHLKTNKKVYCEPFIGSGQILFNLDKEFEHYVINDLDRNIIRIYKTFKEISYNDYLDVVESVFKEFGHFTTDKRRASKMEIKEQKESYYNFRNWFNQNHWKTDSLIEGIYLHMLQNSCINSFLRFGPNGMNQSQGLRFYYQDKISFNKIKNVLSKSEIHCGSYKEVLNKDYFHFFDPPYMSQDSSYQGFSENDLKEFLEIIHEKDLEFLYTDIKNEINSEYFNSQNSLEIREMRSTSPNVKGALKSKNSNLEYLFSSYDLELSKSLEDW